MNLKVTELKVKFRKKFEDYNKERAKMELALNELNCTSEGYL